MVRQRLTRMVSKKPCPIIEKRLFIRMLQTEVRAGLHDDGSFHRRRDSVLSALKMYLGR